MAETTPIPPGGAPPHQADYIAAAADLLALPLDPAWIAAVGANLSVLRAAHDLVAGFPLPDEAEPAPVFAA